MDVADIHVKIRMTITRKSAKAKGKRLEKLIRDKIKEAFDLDNNDIRVAVGQENGADIKLSARAKARFPFSLECKARASFNTLYGFLEQAAKHEPKLIPLVIIKGDRKEPLCIIDFESFLTLVNNN